MCSVVKHEFKLSNVWLNHSKPESFYTSQWRFPWPVFIIYRLVVAAYSVFAFTRLIVNAQISASRGQGLPYNIMAYLTTWTYLVLTLNLLLAASVAVWCHYRARSKLQKESIITNIKTISSNSVYCDNNPTFSHKHEHCEINYNTSVDNDQINVEKLDITTKHSCYDVISDADVSMYVQDPAIMENNMPWYLKLSWILWNIISVDAIVVTAIYFGALYGKLQLQRGNPGISFDNLNIHALNTVFVMIDVAISPRPVRLLHVIYPVMYSMVYILFSILFWCRDHSNVLYSGVLDWNNAGYTTGVVVIVGVVILPTLQLCHFVLYRLRLFIYKKVYGVEY